MTGVWALAAMWLDAVVFRAKWKEAVSVGLASFALPFLGCAAAARWLLGWEVMPSWLAGVAMSTTSVAEMGCMAGRVVHLAKCPVLVVK
jgi:Kef-type K+ transport system membrane component KefB